MAFALQGFVVPDVPITRKTGTGQREIRWIQVDSAEIRKN
jgi:hypothetical protein